jgi:hypothetical protein
MLLNTRRYSLWTERIEYSNCEEYWEKDYVFILLKGKMECSVVSISVEECTNKAV